MWYIYTHIYVYGWYMYFSATQTDLDIIILSKSERQIPYDITHMQNLNRNTNEHIYETKIDSQM